LKNPYLENDKYFWFDETYDIYGPYEKYEEALKDFNIYFEQLHKPKTNA
jgi:hypothetical protein